jgi:hypothetical protein
VITTNKNYIPWNKNHIPHPRKPRQRHPERINFRRPLQWPHPLWMWLLNVWGNVPMDLEYVCQQYFVCMCFLGFIRYNKTFIACGSGNMKMHSPTSIIFPSGVALMEYDTLGWIHFYISLINMQYMYIIIPHILITINRLNWLNNG